MTSINVVAQSLGHHEGAMKRLKLLTAFRTEALIRFTSLPFSFIVPTLVHLLFQATPICGLGTYYYFMLCQVYIIGGDGTQKGASVIFEVMQFNEAPMLICDALD